MSKYQHKYISSSKGAVDIEGMATPHLANALRKLREKLQGPDDGAEPGHLALVETAVCMEAELRERGATYDAETGQWTFAQQEARP